MSQKIQLRIATCFVGDTCLRRGGLSQGDAPPLLYTPGKPTDASYQHPQYKLEKLDVKLVFTMSCVSTILICATAVLNLTRNETEGLR